MPPSPDRNGPAALRDLTQDLKRAMPSLRGALAANAPLAPLSWFRTGGPAKLLFEPADEEDLAYFLARLDPAIPVFVLGAGSNILIRDGGIEGAVILLGKEFQRLSINGLSIAAGAGVPDVKLAAAAAKAGIAGFSFYRGIPGTIGGALRMNAGAYGAETKDVLLSCRGISRKGESLELSCGDMKFTYRHCGAAGDLIFTSALFAGCPGDSETILAEMAKITKERFESQPVNTRTGGSTFKNPPGLKAWELIDRAGCRGLALGGAQVSELHCNFLINRGGATAAEIETLGETVRKRVLETSGVTLEWEILRVGKER
ncbi:MAG TPA: UDP-N-acetylmuramate dehydrogenase [Methylocella sp.]|nr:UDP-N-acetylmuramate dehydrogenase [Methylocella sp.]